MSTSVFILYDDLCKIYHIFQWLCLILLEVSSVTVNIGDFYQLHTWMTTLMLFWNICWSFNWILKWLAQTNLQFEQANNGNQWNVIALGQLASMSLWLRTCALFIFVSINLFPFQEKRRSLPFSLYHWLKSVSQRRSKWLSHFPWIEALINRTTDLYSLVQIAIM